MHSPLANYFATDPANDTQQYTATNGKALQPPERKTRSCSTKTTEIFKTSTI